MEIPTAVIHRLQSSLREATSAPPVEDVPAPPFPSIADAIVAALDSGAVELRCVRCGAAVGLLRGVQSALCTYCGCPRRGDEAQGAGSGGIAFRDGGGCSARWD